MSESTSVAGIGWTGVILSIFLYASQLPLMRRLWRERDATLPGYSYLPILGQIAQAGPWCGYALCIQPTVALLAANFAGVGFAWLYLIIFAVFTPTLMGRLKIMVSGTVVCGAIVAFYVRGVQDVMELANIVFLFATKDLDNPLFCLQALLFSPATGPSNETAIQIAGIVTVVVNQAFWVVPFVGLWRALNSLDTRRISLLLSALQLIALSVWSAYGVLLQDVYVQVLKSGQSLV